MPGLEAESAASSTSANIQNACSVPRLLAARAGRAVVTYALLCTIVLWTTEYSRRFPLGAGCVVALLAIVSALRLLAARRILREAAGTGGWRTLLYLTTLASGAIWGLCAAAVVTLGFASDGMVVLVVTAGISAGAITSLAPQLALAQAYSVVVLVPLIVGGLMHGASAPIGVALGGAVFLGFSLLQSSQSHAEFVTAQGNVERLEQRAIALEEARGAAEAAQGEAVRASRAKSSLLTDVSHEIRGPMVSILGYSELLSAPDVGDEARTRYAAAIHRSGQHLMEIINDILDTARLEAGKMSYVVEPVQVSRILSDVDAAMCIRAQQRRLEFEIAIDTPVPEYIRTDPLRLRQILLNLVGNAIKFTDSGRVSVRARFDDARKRMAFDVIDTGVGLSSVQVERLFERFVQVHAANQSQGSGVGLALSRSIARELGGDISVTSAVGNGSTFTLDLPVGDLEGVPVVSHVWANVAHSSGTFAATDVRLTLNALVADDDADIRALTVEFLTAAGASVEQATDGEQVLALMLPRLECGNPPDVVLLDMHMPLLDGYDTASLLRKAGYRGTIIALTGSVGESERQRCIDAGCDEYAAKPIRRLLLLQMLSRASHQAPGTGPSASDVTSAPTVGDANLENLEKLEPLESTLADDPIVKPMLPQVLAGLGARKARLEQALAQSDLVEVGQLAHDLIGLGGTFGYDELTARARQLSRAVKAQQPREVVDAAATVVLSLCRRILAAKRGHNAA